MSCDITTYIFSPKLTAGPSWKSKVSKCLVFGVRLLHIQNLFRGTAGDPHLQHWFVQDYNVRWWHQSLPLLSWQRKTADRGSFLAPKSFESDINKCGMRRKIGFFPLITDISAGFGLLRLQKVAKTSTHVGCVKKKGFFPPRTDISPRKFATHFTEFVGGCFSLTC